MIDSSKCILLLLLNFILVEEDLQIEMSWICGCSIAQYLLPFSCITTTIFMRLGLRCICLYTRFPSFPLTTSNGRTRSYWSHILVYQQVSSSSLVTPSSYLTTPLCLSRSLSIFLDREFYRFVACNGTFERQNRQNGGPPCFVKGKCQI